MLPAINYDPNELPSLFERWEQDPNGDPPAPLAVRDGGYRRLIRGLLEPQRRQCARLLSVGAGTGRLEAELAATGWEVLATDCSEAALRACEAKGLTTMRFCLTQDQLAERFPVIYCDGVLGHLWDAQRSCEHAWRSLAAIGRVGSHYLLSNDLADDDSAPCFAVRRVPDARFYRPPAGEFAAEALGTRRFVSVGSTIYAYERMGAARRREIITLLLVDEGVEAEDGFELHRH